MSLWHLTLAVWICGALIFGAAGVAEKLEDPGERIPPLWVLCLCLGWLLAGRRAGLK